MRKLFVAGALAVLAVAALYGIRLFIPTPVAATVTLTRQGFSPTDISVRKGESVRFVSGVSSDCDLSQASCFIWPASDPHPSHEFYPEFDPREPLGPGESWVFTFDKAGEWGYHDHFKSSSRGLVRVIEAPAL